MAIDLSSLVEKKKEYVKNKADEIVQDMFNRNVTTSKLATCGARNWDNDLHNNMSAICSELRKMGITSDSSVNWGVTDWVFTIKI